VAEIVETKSRELRLAQDLAEPLADGDHLDESSSRGRENPRRRVDALRERLELAGALPLGERLGEARGEIDEATSLGLRRLDLAVGHGALDAEQAVGLVLAAGRVSDRRRVVPSRGPSATSWIGCSFGKKF
jgi:hypothetical protein